MEKFNPNVQEENSENPERQAVKAIESINTGTEQRAQIILVLLGLKPATELSLFANNSTPEETEALLEQAGLLYIRKESNDHQWTSAKYEYVVAKDEATLQQLLNSSSSESHEEYGLLMGYPETAVKAFTAGDLYDGPLPADIEDSIFKLRFSKDHFEEEFETVRKWNTAINEYAPELLSQ
jgi:hypothetical protein